MCCCVRRRLPNLVACARTRYYVVAGCQLNVENGNEYWLAPEYEEQPGTTLHLTQVALGPKAKGPAVVGPLLPCGFSSHAGIV